MCVVSVLQKFMFYVLKSSDVLDILVPILFYLNDARADQCRCNVDNQLPEGLANFNVSCLFSKFVLVTSILQESICILLTSFLKHSTNIQSFFIIC